MPLFRDECKSQVDKFPSASFKKFASERDAWAFIRGAEPTAPPNTNKGTLNSMQLHKVFVDSIFVSASSSERFPAIQ